MNLTLILTALRMERARINEAITALERLDTTTVWRGSARPPSAAAPRKRRRTHRMSAAGRKKLSDMMKARWAARRKGKS